MYMSEAVSIRSHDDLEKLLKDIEEYVKKGYEWDKEIHVEGLHDLSVTLSTKGRKFRDLGDFREFFGSETWPAGSFDDPPNEFKCKLCDHSFFVQVFGKDWVKEFPEGYSPYDEVREKVKEHRKVCKERLIKRYVLERSGEVPVLEIMPIDEYEKGKK